MTTSHSELQNSPAAGQTTWTWNLRQDILFSDGQPVTAHDVCFSVLSDRDAPSRLLGSSVADVISCTTIGTRTAQIVVSGLSSFDELNLGGIFIVPEHVWAPLCGGLKTGTDACVTPSNLASRTFDPAAAGDMVGSGPWVCNPTQGTTVIVGNVHSCTQNANGSEGGQALGAGARVLMKRNLSYMRCCGNVITKSTPWLGTANFGTNLQALEWSDFFKTGKVGITDIAAAATVFGQTCPSIPTATAQCYFAHPFYSANPASGSVDIGDIAVAAFYFDHGITAPFTGTSTGFASGAPPAGLTQYGPAIDPYDPNGWYVQGFNGNKWGQIPVVPAPAQGTWSLYTDTATTGLPDSLCGGQDVEAGFIHPTPVAGRNNILTNQIPTPQVAVGEHVDICTNNGGVLIFQEWNPGV